MTEYTLLKSKNYELIKDNNLLDSDEIALITKVQIKSNQGNMIVPIPFAIAVKDNTVALIQAPPKGFFIETPKVTQKTIDERIEFDKLNVINTSYVKVLGGKKLHISVAPNKTRNEVDIKTGEVISDGLFTGEIIFDVTKKLELAFTKLLSKLEKN